MLVREIGLSCVHSVIGNSFGIGLTFAVFQRVGTDWCMIRVAKYLSDNRCKLVSIVFPQPMGS